MKKIIFYSLILILAHSCQLDGVEDQVEDNSIVQNFGSDSVETVDENMLLVDTINGEANEMVFQRDDGLRVEWEIKKEDKKIELNDVVMVNYTARVAAGEVYDTNDKLGKPVPLKSNIGMMIPGWEAGLLEMHEGDKGRIMIPASLGYGEDGYMTVVPPRADIIVDIEIVSIIKPIILDDGVKVYKWNAVAEGKTPEKNQEITFDYFAYKKGKDKGMYDNSYQNETAFSFKYQNASVVDGLHIGMSVMKEGESAFFEIPAKAGYGSKGLLDLVPKNTDIVYDVRIESIL